ncbi:hypothetical protein ACU60T_24450 [Klebsiella aerogenes]
MKRALRAIDDAASALRHARSRTTEGRRDIDRALSEPDDAEREIRRALRELLNEE